MLTSDDVGKKLTIEEAVEELEREEKREALEMMAAPAKRAEAIEREWQQRSAPTSVMETSDDEDDGAKPRVADKAGLRTAAFMKSIRVCSARRKRPALRALTCRRTCPAAAPPRARQKRTASHTS